MRIVKLVLCNFKSYKGTLEVDFGDNAFSAIIGPNGVGKSNLMDAISFVFGSSIAELRTRTFKDLIYRDSEDGSVADEAYVAAEFEDVTLRRTIMGGQTGTRFKVGRRNVDQQAYLAKLGELGISKNSNSMVFQGSIERMANLSARELSELFEDISGSAEFRDEYDAKSEDYDEKRSRATALGKQHNAQLAEVKKIRDGLDAMRKRARNLDKIGELEQHEINLRAAAIQCSIGECKQQIKTLRREKRSLAKNLDASTEAAQEVKTKLVEAVRELQDLEDKQRSLESSTNSAIAQIHTSRAKVSNSQHKIKSLEPQLRCQQGEVELHRKDLERNEVLLANAKHVCERSAEGLRTYAGDMVIYEKCMYEFKVETALDQDKVDKARREIKSLGAELSATQKLCDAGEARLAAIKQHHSVTELAAQEENELIQSYETQRADLLGEVSDLEQELVEMRRSMSELEQTIRTKSRQAREMTSDKRRSDQRNSKLERVQKLKRKVPGVVGLLYTLIQPTEERFTAAIDLIVGANFDAVVVNTISTAKKCIAVCQEQNLGVMTFLPLDGLHSRHVDNRLRSLPGSRLAIDAIQFERDYAAAIEYACGDTLLCDSADIAFDLFSRHHVKMVSVDGTVLQTNSVVTAGNYQSNRFDSTRVATLRVQLTELVDEYRASKLNSAALSDKLSNLQASITSIDSKTAEVRDKQRLTTATLTAYSDDLDVASRNLQDVRGRRSDVQDSIDAAKARLDDVEQGYSGLKRRVFAPFTETCDTDIHTFQKALEKRQEIEAGWEQQRQLFQQEAHFTQRQLKAAENRVQQLQALIDEHAKIAADNRLLVTQAQTTQERNSADLKECADLAVQLEAKIDGLNGELKAMQSKELDQTEEVDDLDRRLERLRHTEENFMQQFELFEGMDADQAHGLAAELETEEEVQAVIQTTQQQLRDLRTQTEQIRDTPTDGIEEAEERLAQLAREHTEAKRESSTAEAALKAVRQARCDAFMTVFTPVANSLAEIYKELTTTEFDPLGGSASLKLANASQPWVGSKFTAMPPRKPFAHISALSGGEKTIAALALIFALNNSRASPIYVLDEVDAALDYANVHLVAKYIQKCAERGSQFVVISLKLWFFEHADNLLGVYRDKGVQGSKLISYAFTAST